MEPRVVVRESFEGYGRFMACVQDFGFNEYYDVYTAYGNTEKEALKNLIDRLNTKIHTLEIDLALVKDKLYLYE